MDEITRIKSRCKEKGVSITFLCKSIGRGAYYLNDVIKSNGSISDDNLKTIADILDTTVSYLRGETDQKEKPDTVNGAEPDKNVVRVIGRDGRNITKILTDEQVKALQVMIDSLPEAGDDI